MARYNNGARNARIIELRQQGLWPTQIADEMALPRNAVIGVLNRAGLCSPDTDSRPATRLKIAKLTVEAVADMRANYVPFSRTLGIKAFAHKHNVAFGTVWRVLNNRSWAAAT